MLSQELSREEKDANIKPDPDINVYMKLEKTKRKEAAFIVTIAEREKEIADLKLKKDIVVGALDLILELNWLRDIRQGDEVLSHLDILENHKPLDSHISNIVVAKESRRLGIASNLIHYATDIATFKGMDKMFLHVAKENKSGSECYKNRGFKMTRFSGQREKKKAITNINSKYD